MGDHQLRVARLRHETESKDAEVVEAIQVTEAAKTDNETIGVAATLIQVEQLGSAVVAVSRFQSGKTGNEAIGSGALIPHNRARMQVAPMQMSIVSPSTTRPTVAMISGTPVKH